jgi:hypothetical protein
MEEGGDATDVEFDEIGTLIRHSHTNPDGSHWSTAYEYEYVLGRISSIRQVGDDSSTVYTHEYDDLGRLRLLAIHHAGSTRVTEEYEYDAAGQRRKIQYLNGDECADTAFALVEDAETYYSAPGTEKIVTLYDERDRPAEVLFYNASGHDLSRVTFSYDEAGNLVEEVQTRPTDAFPDLFASAPPEQRETFAKMYQSIAGAMRTVHTHEQGNRVETRRSFGLMSEQTTTRTYNEYRDVVTAVSTEHSRGFGVDEQGELVVVPDSERRSRSETRIQYEYDQYRNWTSQITEARSGSEQDFMISSIEKRVITYF